MAFNSIAFCFFLPTVFIVHWRCRTRAARNVTLLTASYIFYGWWDWRFLSLILLSSLIDFCCGLRIAGTTGSGSRQRWLSLSLAANLGLLGVFKYFNFFAESTAEMLRIAGLNSTWTDLQIVLPVGISFYTFQTLSYTIDVYRGRCQVCRHPPRLFSVRFVFSTTCCRTDRESNVTAAAAADAAAFRPEPGPTGAATHPLWFSAEMRGR